MHVQGLHPTPGATQENDVSVTENLISGESVIFESKKHWMAPIRASLVAGLMVIGAWVLWLIAPGGGEGISHKIGRAHV